MWDSYLKAAGIDQEAEVIVRQPSHYENLNSLLSSTPLETWKTYFKWHLLTNYAGVLNAEFDQEDFQFLRKDFNRKTRTKR